ncbi:MAG: peptidylprolyl isomerase [Bradymonadia bacterium]
MVRRDIRRRTLIPVIFTACLLAAVSSTAQESAEYLAQVELDGQRVAITKARLLNYAASQPEKPLAELLNDLIEFELLAIKASQSGLAEERFVIRAQNEAMVARYLKGEFEPQWTSEKIPKKYLEASFEQNRSVFNHPELREASHIIVTIDGERPKDPSKDAKASALMDKIHSDMKANPASSLDAFLERATIYQDEATQLGLQVSGQRLRKFARKGRFAKAFTDEVFAYDTPKTIIPPFVTKFGYHLVWLEKAIPAKAQTLEDVEDNLRAKIAPEVRRLKIRSLTDELSKRYPAISNRPGVRRLANPKPLELLELSEANRVD